MADLVSILRQRVLYQTEQEAYAFLGDEATEISRLSYGELDRRVRDLAAALQQVVPAGERALLLYPPGFDYIIAFLGCLYAGLIAVPAYPPRRAKNDRPFERVKHIIRDVQPAIALTTSSLHPLIADIFGQQGGSYAFALLDTDNLSTTRAWQCPKIASDSPAFIQYTSGSTSEPKGTVLTHGNLLSNLSMIARHFGNSEKSRGVIWLPPYHDMGLIGGILQPLYVGFPVLLMAPITFLQSPIKWLQAISLYRATSSGGPNFAYDLCAHRVTAEQKATLDLSCWEVAFNGSEPIQGATLERFVKAFAQCGFRREAFYPCYGLAENTLIVTGGQKAEAPLLSTFYADELEQHRAIPALSPTPDRAVRLLVGCGKPLPEQRLAIVHPQTLQKCAAGSVGEIWTAGPSVADGYWQKATETAETFRSYTADDHDGPFLRTGDLGFVQDGELFVTGRLKEVIILRGRNYYPQDIELTIGQCHNALIAGRGAAFAIPIKEEMQLVVVQEIERHAMPATIDEILQTMVRAVATVHELSLYDIVLIRPGSLPQTSSGKTQRQLCGKLYEDDQFRVVARLRNKAQATEDMLDPALLAQAVQTKDFAIIEQFVLEQLQSIAKILLPPDTLDRSFIELGFDSLMITQFKMQVEMYLPITLQIEELLSNEHIHQFLIQLRAMLSEPLSQDAVSTIYEAAVTPDGQVIIPLSHGQQALWFISTLHPRTAAYTITRLARISSSMDVVAFKKASQHLVDRHAALRTTFAMRDNSIVQIVHAQQKVAFAVVDASGWQEDYLQEQLQEVFTAPFDLEQGPLFRIHLFVRSSQEYLLVLAMHHIIVDLWSLAILIDELLQCYTCLVAGMPLSLPPVLHQYQEYVLQQHNLLAGPTGDRLWRYWHQQLLSVPPVLDIPTDYRRCQVQNYQGRTYHATLPADLVAQLKSLSCAHNVTLYITLLTTFALWLQHYSRQQDMVIGSPTAGRKSRDFSDVIGYFFNILPIRVTFSDDLTFEKLLQVVQKTVLDGLRSQEYPFDILVQKLHIERDSAYSPLIQFMFVMQNMSLLDKHELSHFILGQAGPAINMGSLSVESLPVDLNGAQFDLTMRVAETGREAILSLEYNTDLFYERTIQFMMQNFMHTLRCIVDSPSALLTSLPLLSALETKHLTYWRDASTALLQSPGMQNASKETRGQASNCLHQRFEARVVLSPGAIAVRDGNETLTYTQLNERANQLAHYLHGLGVNADTLVGLSVERSLDVIVGIIGVLKAGGAYVPLDPTYPKERLAFLLEDAHIAVLVTQQRILACLPAYERPHICLDADQDVLKQQSMTNPTWQVRSDQCAYVIYTSGSTGKPKGVVVSHANVMRLFSATEAWFHFSARDVWTLFHSYAFDFSVWEIWGALLYGGTLIVVPYWMSRSPQDFYKLLGQEGVTILNQTPSAFRQLQQVALQVGDNTLQNHLRYVIFGGEALEIQRLRPWFEHYGELRPQLVNMYGITETTVHVTYRPIKRWDVEQEVGSVIGQPIPDLDLYIVDNHMREVPIGAPGELYVGGKGVARGYLNRTELTQQRFIQNPFRPDVKNVLYKTGDLVRYRENGELEYLHRVDAQVKIRGFRIELEEIQEALHCHPLVTDAVVTAQQDSEGEKSLVAYLVVEPEGASIAVSEWRAFLLQKLPDYMVPGTYFLLDTLPLTPHGKLDVNALPTHETQRFSLEYTYTAPSTQTETTLAMIWEQVLKQERVGVDDNFFDLGGDSIKSIQIVAQANEHNIHCSVYTLFRYQTIRALVQNLEDMDSVSSSGEGEQVSLAPFELISLEDHQLLPEDIEDAYPLTMLQHGLIFHSQFSADYEVYLSTLHIHLPFEHDTLAHALDLLIERHEMLRTWFDITSYQEPLQLVHRRSQQSLRVVDIRHYAVDEQEAALATFIEQEKKRSIEWNMLPLARFSVHRRTDETFQLTMSEPFLDGWSVALVLTELLDYYLLLLRGDAVTPRSRLQASFRDYVWLELQQKQSETAQHYWQEILQDAVIHTLPPRIEAQTVEDSLLIQRVDVPVAPEISTALRQLARQLQVPLKSILLAAHMRVMSLLYGSADVLTGLISNGRPEKNDGDKIIGIFLNALPFRLKLSSHEKWNDLIQKVFLAEQELLLYRRYPIALLQQQRNRQILFETVFNFTHFHVYDLINDAHILDSYASEQTFYPLTIQCNIDHVSLQIRLSLDYSTKVLSREQAALIGAYFSRALTSMAIDPERSCDNLQLLSPEEQRTMLLHWNDTYRAYDHTETVVTLFQKQAREHPAKPALVFQGEMLTYGELERRSNQLAHVLQRAGVGPDSRVAICLDRTLDLFIAIYATLKANGAYVPLDPSYPQERLSFMLRDAEVLLLITSQHLQESLTYSSAPLLILERAWETMGQEADIPPVSYIMPENLAYVIYTSGSTGIPKGVAISHRALANFLQGMLQQLGVGSAEVALAVTSLSFDIAGLELFLPLLVGGCVELAGREEASNGTALAERIERCGVTLLQATPATWRLLLGAGWRGNKRLKMLCGGEALPHDLASQLSTMGAGLWNMYGPTETTIWSTCSFIAQEQERITIGHPIANTQVYVLDSEYQLVPAGVVGELYIGGDGVARGYLNRPDLTAERFVPHPFSQQAGARIYRTGDLARFLPDGSLDFLGRNDYQVKMRGFRIELGEIQDALRGHPLVENAVVMARHMGGDEAVLVAYLVVKPEGETIAIDEWRAFARQHLPYYMVPGVFLLLKALPLTINGKLDLKALPDPQQLSTASLTAFVEPETLVEKAVARIFCAILHREQVSILENFFQLGGHSLLAVQVVSRIRQTLQIQLPLTAIFEAANLQQLAQIIEQMRAEQDQKEFQEMLLFVQQLSDEQVHQRLSDNR